MNFSLARLPLLTLLFVVLMTVAFFIFAHEGLYALDDYFYSRYAHQLLNGTFRVQPDPLGLLHDPLKERPLIFGPVAGLYALLGINIISTTLWPLLATLGCVGILYALYHRRAPVVASAAMLLLGLHYFTLDLTRYLYPDNILMLWCLASAAALLRGRQATRRRVLWGAGFALLNFAALLSKETIVYYLPFYLLLLGRDVLHRRHGRFWLAALLTGAALLGAYLWFYQVYTNDALYRLHLIEHTNEFMRDNNYLFGNRAALVARITWQPLAFLVNIGLGLMLVLAGVAFPLLRRPHSDARFWLVLAGSTLLLYWVGSTSLSQYNPITLLPRMTTPLLPPLALAAGFGVARLWQTGRGYWVAGGVLLALAVWLHTSQSALYALPGLYFVGVGAWRRSQAARQLALPATAALTVLVLAAALSIRPVYFMRKPSVSAHFAQDRLIRQQLAAPAGGGVVFVDDYLIGNYDFYHGYQLPQNLQYRRYWARDSVQLAPGQQAWLLLNRATLSNDELTRTLIRYSPDSVLSWYPHRHLIAQDGRVELYKVNPQ
ncbi:hypothetical protein MUN82_09340 [Hymenobacter aerilatus]|uniref:Glycosyltransferase RgtA/B/C/D-like domain-containing protein n=1 Tax=Hymenobacter aerilatus TaxID=2932251 RepID=A0A8T9T5B4_9BACT|nr:hypothetical protein [Hymenobacter aerilatus]UOR07286.1 hypothetical protein MUN82_09340 [Hymenobacter aerilatus]